MILLFHAFFNNFLIIFFQLIQILILKFFIVETILTSFSLRFKELFQIFNNFMFIFFLYFNVIDREKSRGMKFVSFNFQ